MARAEKMVFVFFGLLLAPLSAQATILDVAGGDKSLEFLNLIQESILSPMSAVLNVGCLMFGGLIIGYTALSGVMSTAHEGKVMGASQNSMWAPIRVIVAVAMLMPLPSGYSVSQLAVAKIAEAGIGLANSTWNTALGYIDNKGVLFPPIQTRKGEQLATAMLRSAACLEITNRSHGESVISRKPRQDTSGDTTTLSQHYTGEGASLFDGRLLGQTRYPLDVCGTVSLAMKTADDELIAPIKIEYINQVQNALGALEEEMYQLARNMIQTHYNRDGNELLMTGKELSQAGAVYDASLKSALAKATIDLQAARQADNNWRDEVGSWYLAGRFYVDIMRLHHATHDFADIQPSTTPPMIEMLHTSDYLVGMELFDVYLKERYTVDKNGKNIKVTDQKDDNELFKIKDGMKTMLDKSIREYDDPMLAMQSLGHGIANTMYTGLITAGTAKIATSGAANSLWLKIVPGGGAVSGGVKELADMMFSGVGMLFLIMLPVIFTLTIYLPTMPFVLWIMGFAGWLILFVEALVAAPIWAVAHAMGGGGDAINQQARAGYMILLSLFLRPTLMLFGMFGGMIVAIIAGKVAVSAFVPMALSVSGDRFIGLITIVGFVIILCMMMISIMHRSYGLIHEVPDKVLRYIGGMGETLGEAQSEQQGRTMVVGAVQKISNTGERAMHHGVGGNKTPSSSAGQTNSIKSAVDQKRHS